MLRAVAGTVAGKVSGKGPDHFPSGIAPNAQLVFFDMRKEGEGTYNPGAGVLFDSVRGGSGNEKGAKGARVVNGSWGRTTRPYSDFCEDYDGGLHKYQDMVYVPTAGISGDDMDRWGER